MNNKDDESKLVVNTSIEYISFDDCIYMFFYKTISIEK